MKKEQDQNESVGEQSPQVLPLSEKGLSLPAVRPVLQRQSTKLSTKMGSADLHDQGSGAKLYNLEVNRKNRGSGGGMELIRKATEEAVSMGKDKLLLDSQDNGSGKLNKWYESQGFKQAGRNNGMNAYELPLQRQKNDNQIPGVPKPALQLKSENQTGLPDQLKSRMEQTFGHSLANVRIKANSSLPAKVGAIATTQGNRIDFAPGQYNPHTSQGQKLIGHEAWHTVQQAQGRVKPTLQMKTGHLVNDSAALEREADLMGERIAKSTISDKVTEKQLNIFRSAGSHPIQRSFAKSKKKKADKEFDVQKMLTHEYWEAPFKTKERAQILTDSKYWPTYKRIAKKAGADKIRDRKVSEIVEDVGKQLLTQLSEQDENAPQLKLYRTMFEDESKGIMAWFNRKVKNEKGEEVFQRAETEAYIMTYSKKDAVQDSDGSKEDAQSSDDITDRLKSDEENPAIIPIKGHLGDQSQALSYTEIDDSAEKSVNQDEEKKPSEKKVTLEFTLKPGAHNLLFSTQYMAVARTGKGASRFMTAASDRVYPKASDNEGHKSGYIGMKSEKRGPFSITMKDSDATHLLFQLMIADIKEL